MPAETRTISTVQWGRWPLLLISALATGAFACDGQGDASSRQEATERDILFTSSRVGSDSEIWRMRPDGSNLRRLTTGDSVRDNTAVWSPDGRRIAFVSNRDEPDGKFGLYVMDADGSDVRAVGPRRWPIVFFPEWSPNGQEILFTAGSGPGDSDLYLMEADGSDVRQLTSSPAAERCGHWAPSGDRIVYVETRGDTTRLMLLDLSGGEPEPLLPDSAEGSCGYWSPDGHRVAFSSPPDLDLASTETRQREGTGVLEIFLYDLRTDSLTQLTHAGVISNYPRWSPDGRRIVFQSTRAFDASLREDGEAHWERFDVYTMNPDGTDVTRITRNRRFDAHPSW